MDEQAATIVCCICSQAKRAFKHFADNGWACRSCVEKADSIVTSYRINGARYVEILKRPANQKRKEKTA